MPPPYTAFKYGDPAAIAAGAQPYWILPSGLKPRPEFFGLYVAGTGIPVIFAEPLAGGKVGDSYSEPILAAGGVSPYTFSLASGSLPGGTSLNTSTGVISGTLTTAGTFSFTIGATDSHGLYNTQAFQIIVASPPEFSYTFAG